MTGVLLACPHRPPCPGCPRFGEPGAEPRALGALAALCREADLPPPTVVEGAPRGYRVRARLAVRGRAASPKLGIFQEGSHRIVDIPNCVVHHPHVNAVAAAVKEAVRATGVAPYADRPHRGDLRYVQVVVERASGRAQIVLVGNAADPESLAPVARRLEASLGDGLHSLWWNGNPARTNVILGPHWHRWSGPDAVEETIGGARVFFPPGAFGQANLDLADRIVAQAHAWVPDGARVVELYAGCGAVGLGLLPRVGAMAFNEASPDAVAGLRLGLAAAPDGSRATVLPGPATAHLAALDGADVVLADPPRKGLDREVIDALVARPPARLVVVSCNLDAFLAEARALTRGPFALRACVPWALFPQTAHVETLALFERTSAS